MSIPKNHKSFLDSNNITARYFDSDEIIDFENLATGVIFVFARWSGASICSFEALCAALAARTKTRINLWLVDTEADNSRQLFLQMNQAASGSGETFAVKDGRVVAVLSKYDKHQMGRVDAFLDALNK
jgi:hypothetical protein